MATTGPVTPGNGTNMGASTSAPAAAEAARPQFTFQFSAATEMILKLAGGKPSAARVAGAPPEGRSTFAFDFARIARLSGLAIKDAESRKILQALGFEIEGKAPHVTVTTPSWRPDIHGQADLVEEVVRIRTGERGGEAL